MSKTKTKSQRRWMRARKRRQERQKWRQGIARWSDVHCLLPEKTRTLREEHSDLQDLLGRYFSPLPLTLGSGSLTVKPGETQSMRLAPRRRVQVQNILPQGHPELQVSRLLVMGHEAWVNYGVTFASLRHRAPRPPVTQLYCDAYRGIVVDVYNPTEEVQEYAYRIDCTTATGLTDAEERVYDNNRLLAKRPKGDSSRFVGRY